MADLLLARDVHVRFPVRRSVAEAVRRRPQRVVRALDGVSLVVQAGEIVALVGESGCGKTTMANAVLGLQRVDAGSVAIDGTDVSGASADAVRDLRRRAQLIFQDPYDALDSRFRVRGILQEPLRIHDPRSSDEKRLALVREALEKVGLTPPDLFLDRFPHELSGGQRQRVSIAAALILRPSLVVADEPVSMLDVSVRADILALMRQLRDEGLGVLMITHDLATVRHFADRIAVMYLGRIVEEGPAAAVIRDPRDPYTQALVAIAPRFGSGPRTRTLLSGEVPDATEIPAGCRFRSRCPIAIQACETIDPTLVDLGAGRSAACIRVEAPGGGSSPATGGAASAGPEIAQERVDRQRAAEIPA